MANIKITPLSPGHEKKIYLIVKLLKRRSCLPQYYQRGHRSSQCASYYSNHRITGRLFKIGPSQTSFLHAVVNDEKFVTQINVIWDLTIVLIISRDYASTTHKSTKCDFLFNFDSYFPETQLVLKVLRHRNTS